MSLFLDQFKETTLGIITLGAVGSIIATVIAAILAYIYKYAVKLFSKARKKSNYDYGYMTGVAIHAHNGQFIFTSFISANLAKIIIQCTISLMLFIISVIGFNTSVIASGYFRLGGYMSFILFSTASIFMIIICARNYIDLKVNVKRAVEKVLEETKRNNKAKST